MHHVIRVNAGRRGPNKRHMVSGSNPATNDTLIYPVLIFTSSFSTPRFGSPWRVLRAWPWKVPRLSKKKKLNEEVTSLVAPLQIANC